MFKILKIKNSFYNFSKPNKNTKALIFRSIFKIYCKFFFIYLVIKKLNIGKIFKNYNISCQNINIIIIFILIPKIIAFYIGFIMVKI